MMISKQLERIIFHRSISIASSSSSLPPSPSPSSLSLSSRTQPGHLAGSTSSSSSKSPPPTDIQSVNLHPHQSPSSLLHQPKLRYANNPTELIIRIQKLCSGDSPNRLDLAIQLVKSSSVRVASISVWTELFKLVLKFKKFSLTYKLFLELKRRSIKPDFKFFTFYFYLISRSPRSRNWSFQRLESIWSQARSTIDSESNSDSIGLTNSYLTCLCSHQFVDQAIDLFESIPSHSVDSTTIYQLSTSLQSTPQDLDRIRRILKHFQSIEEPHEQLDIRTCLRLASLFLRSTNRSDHQFGSRLVQDRLGIDLEPNRYQFWVKSKPPIILHPETKLPLIRFDAGQLTTLLRMLLRSRKYSLIRRLWSQIVSNRDLYLKRDSLDKTHCGLAMIAMGKSNATDEIQDLLVWMIKSGDKRLRPNSDTLDKAIQSAWQVEDLSLGIRILASLTQNYDEELIRPGTKDESDQLVTLTRASELKPRLAPIWPSNRALCTILQTSGKLGAIGEIDRALRVIEVFSRQLPEKTSIERSQPRAETFFDQDEDGSEDEDQFLEGAREDLGTIEKYWYHQFIWVLTDLLDKILLRSQDSPDRLSNVISSDRLQSIQKWRSLIDRHLSSDRHQFLELRARIEHRHSLRLLRRSQSEPMSTKPDRSSPSTTRSRT